MVLCHIIQSEPLSSLQELFRFLKETIDTDVYFDAEMLMNHISHPLLVRAVRFGVVLNGMIKQPYLVYQLVDLKYIVYCVC